MTLILRIDSVVAGSSQLAVVLEAQRNAWRTASATAVRAARL